MNVVVDTNIMLLLMLSDDAPQQEMVLRLFEEADSIVVSTLVLCEMVWVLRARYKIDRQEIVERINAMTETEKIIVADDEVRAVLDMLESGGDFADGVVAYVGRGMVPGGTAVFASFDQTAVRLMSQCGYSAFVLH